MHGSSLFKVSLIAGLLSCLAPLFSPTVADDKPHRPQYGAWGFDLAGADFGTKPGNDFFRYVNGTWTDRTQIPADKPAYSLRLNK
jgi:putative endopeptidase